MGPIVSGCVFIKRVDTFAGIWSYAVNVVSLKLGEAGSFVDGYYIPHPAWKLGDIGTLVHKTYIRTYDNQAVTDVIYQIHVSRRLSCVYAGISYNTFSVCGLPKSQCFVFPLMFW